MTGRIEYRNPYPETLYVKIYDVDNSVFSSLRDNILTNSLQSWNESFSTSRRILRKYVFGESTYELDLSFDTNVVFLNINKVVTDTKDYGGDNSIH